MCEFISGWINVKTKEPELADLRSHSESQEILKWTFRDLEHRREWEWTADDDGASLKVRTSPSDPPDLAGLLRAELLTRWPTRTIAIGECCQIVARNGGNVSLDNMTLPAGFTLGDVRGYVSLDNVTLPEGFTLGDVGGNVSLYNVTLPEGFTLGDVGGYVHLYNMTLPAGFTLGDVGGYVHLNNAKASDGTPVITIEPGQQTSYRES